MNYLGHIILEQGVVIDPVKIMVVIEWLMPTTTKVVRGILSLTEYYQIFIAVPLNQLLTNGGFQWNDATKETFQNLKIALTTQLDLCVSDFTQQFVIKCNASGIRIEATLSQNNLSITYCCKALKGTILALSIYEKEMFTLILPIQKWYPYLLGKLFTNHTDKKVSSICSNKR